MVRALASQMFLPSTMRADGAGFGAQALAAAVGAGGVAAILREEDADVQLVLLAFELGEEAADAGPCTAAVEDEVLLGFGEVVPGDVDGDAFGLAARFISACQGERYLGFVHGSMAPSSRDLRCGRG